MNQSTTASAGRRPEFVTLIAVYQFVTAGVLFLLSCVTLAVILPSVFLVIEQAGGVFTAIITAGIALVLFLGFGFASLAVGWGLLRMREWARIGAIVLAAFALVGFPIWTIVAILVLVYMTSDEARSAFDNAVDERERRATGDPRYHDALAAQAAYKTEPAPQAGASPLDHTRPMGTPSTGTAAYGGTASGTPSEEETRRMEPIPMPPPSDPAEATEHLYDEESDVSDHYRRWKASLPQESPQTEQTPEAEQPPSERPREDDDDVEQSNR